MKHRDRLANRVAMELALPVDGNCVFQRPRQDSWNRIPILQLFHSLPNTASQPSSPITADLDSDPLPYVRNPWGEFNTHKASYSGAA
jgi:hypothetical protein